MMKLPPGENAASSFADASRKILRLVRDKVVTKLAMLIVGNVYAV